MATYSAEVLADTPTVFLKMDEASGNLTDSSGNSHTATVTGSPTYHASGPGTGVPYGITIASGAYFSIGDHADLDLGNGPFTIEVWVKRGTSSDNGDVLGKADGSATAGYIVNMSSTDYARLEDGSTSAHVYPDSATYLNDTSWHHIVYTRASATNAKCYVDGVDRTDVGGAKTFTDNAQSFLVGRGYSAGSSYAGATIAAVAIYKSELSSGRVAAHYAAKDTAAASGYWAEVIADSPKVLYKLDDASGNAVDSSGNSHTATAVGSPTYAVAGPTSGIPSAIGFPSGAYFSLADHVDLDLGNGPFSIEGWFKRQDTTTGADLLGKADGSATSGYIVNMSSTDYLRLEDGSTSSHVYQTDPSTLDNTDWHYFCYTRASATNAKVYIDGTDVTSLGAAKTFTDNSTALLIGRGYASGSSFGGALAGIAIYKSELSSARVAAHYAARGDTGSPAASPTSTTHSLASLANLRSLTT